MNVLVALIARIFPSAEAAQFARDMAQHMAERTAELERLMTENNNRAARMPSATQLKHKG